MSNLPEDVEAIKAGGYADAFYEMAALLGICAQAASPKEVYENQIKPELKRVLANQVTNFVTTYEILPASWLS